ncbi:MAG: Mu transposase domain-containing protein, partial [Gammaproteobacteria bacterium]
SGGLTHERPLDRFRGERVHLMVTAGQPGFRLEALSSRTVATDHLVSFETNRYSVPFRLIGETVQVKRRGEQLQVFHRGELVASHPVLSGKYQMRILPELGPGRLPAMPACAIPLRRGARQGAPRSPRCKCAIWPSTISSPVSVPRR